MTLKLGLTGGIGSGKSTVAKIFALLGVPVYYADVVSRQLYETDDELKRAVKKNFGEDVYQENRLDRQRLAKIVFSNPEKLALLNKLVHPPTIRHAEEWMKQQTAPYVIKEAALIFESGSAVGLDYVIGVRSPLQLRLQRTMERDKVPAEEIMKRMDRQIDEDVKMKLCDFIIHNDESQLVIPQVIALDKKLRKMAGGDGHI